MVPTKIRIESIMLAFVLCQSFTQPYILSQIDGLNAEAEVRVVAHTQQEVSEASENDCEIVTQARILTALVCPESVLEFLGLPEDQKIVSTELDSNRVIRANIVHNPPPPLPKNDGSGRIIAVLDSGMDKNHPALMSSFLAGRNFIQGQDPNDITDNSGHGTHVAGIITADADCAGCNSDAIGVAPGAMMVVGKVLEKNTVEERVEGFYSDVVAAIEWAVDNYKPDAINLSIAGADNNGNPIPFIGFCDSEPRGWVQDLRTAIRYAVARNVLVVAGSGNEAFNGVTAPGCLSEAVTVGGTLNDGRDSRYIDSGTGPAVDISAPGDGINTAPPGILSTCPAALPDCEHNGQKGYKRLRGTSMATPMVSGTIALIKKAHPDYSADMVRFSLFVTAVDYSCKDACTDLEKQKCKPAGIIPFLQIKDPCFGWGRVDAFDPVRLSQQELFFRCLSGGRGSLCLQTGIACSLQINANPTTQPTKFVADDQDDKVYKYAPGPCGNNPPSNPSGDFSLSGGNNDPSGIAVVGTKVFVLDKIDKKVYRYGTSGGAPSVSKTLRESGGTILGSPTGLAIDGGHLWVVDDSKLKIYRYSLASAFSGSGNLNAAQEISFSGGNGSAEGLAIDTTYLYVLDDSVKKFYQYPRAGGSGIESLTMKDFNGGSLSELSGATLDGASLWIVDRVTDKAYEYELNLLFIGIGSLLAKSQFMLTNNNDDAQGV